MFCLARSPQAPGGPAQRVLVSGPLRGDETGRPSDERAWRQRVRFPPPPAQDTTSSRVRFFFSSSPVVISGAKLASLRPRVVTSVRVNEEDYG